MRLPASPRPTRAVHVPSAQRSRDRRLAPLATAVVIFFLAAPDSVAAQGGEASPPEVVADEFNRGFQTMAWAGLVQRIHPDALGHVRLAVDILMDIDTTGYVLDRLLGGTTPDEYPQLSDEEAVRRTLAGIQREVPGLLSSLTARRTEVVGVVPEGDDRHVVYRTLSLLQGAVPRVEVMTLSRAGGRWKVREASDIQTLHTAIRGIPLPRNTPQAFPPGE
jgi:hypothetical protein